jgi:hypothetical protein
VGTAIAIHFVPQFALFRNFRPIVIVWLLGTALCDVTITMSLTWHLVNRNHVIFVALSDVLAQRRHKTGFNTTDDILNKIIRREIAVI